MKSISILLSVISIIGFANFSNSQLSISINGFPDDEAQNTMFRGMDNVLEITPIDEDFEYTIETENVNTTQVAISDDPSTKKYLIRIGSGKTVTFKFHKKGEKAVFQTLTCQASNVPDPVVHFDNIPSGQKIPKTAQELSVKHLYKFRLNNTYTITQFTMSAGGQYLTSEDGTLTPEMKKVLGQLFSEETVLLTCRVLGQDGITRLMAASFEVE